MILAMKLYFMDGFIKHILGTEALFISKIASFRVAWAFMSRDVTFKLRFWEPDDFPAFYLGSMLFEISGQTITVRLYNF